MVATRTTKLSSFFPRQSSSPRVELQELFPPSPITFPRRHHHHNFVPAAIISTTRRSIEPHPSDSAHRKSRGKSSLSSQSQSPPLRRPPPLLCCELLLRTLQRTGGRCCCCCASSQPGRPTTAFLSGDVKSQSTQVVFPIQSQSTQVVFPVIPYSQRSDMCASAPRTALPGRPPPAHDDPRLNHPSRFTSRRRAAVEVRQRGWTPSLGEPQRRETLHAYHPLPTAPFSRNAVIAP